MKKIVKHLKKISSRSVRKEIEWPPVNLDEQIEKVRTIEAEGDPGLGKRIHHFDYRQFELRLDRDITGMYRVIANVGNERRYSFSIRCSYKDYEALRICFEEIMEYLGGDRRIVNLPNHERMKGHYFGS